jgi:hypothetical protein
MSLVLDSIIEKPFLPSPDTSGKPSATFHKMHLQITTEGEKKSLCLESQHGKVSIYIISNVLKFFRPK